MIREPMPQLLESTTIINICKARPIQFILLHNVYIFKIHLSKNNLSLLSDHLDSIRKDPNSPIHFFLIDDQSGDESDSIETGCGEDH